MAQPELARIDVRLGARSYPVVLAQSLIGLGASLSERFPVGRCIVVSNPVVAPLHADAALASLRAAGWDASLLLIPDGEEHKNLATWGQLVADLLSNGVDRKTPVLALGGGVTGDMVGFAAASVLRGVPFIQVPTTLLAMVDASVGGKTGVNTPHGKNLVGAFYQPSLVYAALDTLRTLPDAELRCGLGEVVKHAVISGEAALARCEALAAALTARDEHALATVVGDSIRTKAGIVEIDETETGPRALLNLGHTLGHAVEAVAGFGVVPHGEAVTIGLLAMTRFAHDQGWVTAPGLVDRLERLLRALSLSTLPPAGLDSASLERAVGFDKKRQRGMVKLVIPVAPGQVELRGLPITEVPGLIRYLERRET